MNQRKFKSGDLVLRDQGNGTAHVHKYIELTDGTPVWRDLGIMRFENNTLTRHHEDQP